MITLSVLAKSVIEESTWLPEQFIHSVSALSLQLRDAQEKEKLQ